MRGLVVLAALCAMVMAGFAASAGAAVLDLTTQDASGWLGGAFFMEIDPPGAQGTGNFDSFLRIQGNNNERGYNTDGTLEFDTKAGLWTHILRLEDVPIVDGSTIPGLTGNYREFLLDINETKSTPLLSLDAIQIFVSSSSTNTGYPNLGTKVFDLGAGNWIKLNYTLNEGSGQGDMAMYLPDSLFSTGDPYIYLYSEFGYQGGVWQSDDGFEEWGVRTACPPTVIPEWSTSLLALSGLVPVAAFRLRRS